MNSINKYQTTKVKVLHEIDELTKQMKMLDFEFSIKDAVFYTHTYSHIPDRINELNLKKSNLISDLREFLSYTDPWLADVKQEEVKILFKEFNTSDKDELKAILYKEIDTIEEKFELILKKDIDIRKDFDSYENEFPMFE